MGLASLAQLPDGVFNGLKACLIGGLLSPSDGELQGELVVGTSLDAGCPSRMHGGGSFGVAVGDSATAPLMEVLCNGCIDGGSHATESDVLILVMLCNRRKVLRLLVADSGGAVNYNAM